MNERVKQASFLAVDILNIVLITLAAIFGVFSGAGALWRAGFGRFVYFTVDSNVLAALALAVALPFKIRRMRSGKMLPAAVTALCSVTGAVEAGSSAAPSPMSWDREISNTLAAARRL